MHRDGHLGAALLVYAPVGYAALSIGFEELAVLGAGAAVALAMLPDVDMRLPGVKHRGPTHTVWFAVLVGVGLGAGGAYLAARGGAPGLDPATVGGFGFLVGTLTTCSHVAADALTPMGVRPFAPLNRRRFTLSVARADNAVANRLLFLAGAGAVGLAFAGSTLVP